MNSKIAILTASPKESGSASDFIADMFARSFDRKGIEVEKSSLHSLLFTSIGRDTLISVINRCDTIVLSTPLYIDGPPHIVMTAMELIAANVKSGSIEHEKRLFVVSNGGYPEASHNRVSLQIFREFAESISFHWLGGLAIGMGAILNIEFFRNLSFIYGSLSKQINEIVGEMTGEMPVAKACFREADAFIPTWLYIFGVRIAARYLAAMNRVWNIYHRPDISAV